MTTNTHTLVLFDIDGTILLYTDNFPHRMFEELFQVFYGVTVSLDEYRFSGKTDRRIISEIAELAGISEAQLLEKDTELIDWIADRLEKHLSPESFTLLPKVNELIEEMKLRPDTTLALLTGNLPRCAELKLNQFQLFDHFEFGAYGIESKDRNDLGPIALYKFHQSKGHHPSNVVIIGDAIADVLVAKHIGAKSLITLTGRTTREEVLPFAPDHIFDDLSNTKEILNAIYS